MSYKLREAPEKLATDNECRHYWMIEDAKGSTSRGVCKLCGEERKFYNSWPGFVILKQNTGVFELPDSPDTEPDGELDELELEESSAGL